MFDRKTKVKAVMTEEPSFVSADTSLQEAAEKMRILECGILPVGDEENVVGIITDRDIVIRAVAKGKDPSYELVSDYMSDDGIHYCEEEDNLLDAAELMRQHHVSRLLVKNDEGKVAGILSLGRILREDESASEIVSIVEQVRGSQVTV